MLIGTLHRRKFRAKYPRASNGTPLQTAEIIAKRSALRHRINAVREVQSIYMPSVPLCLATYRQHLPLLDSDARGHPLPLPAPVPAQVCRSCWAVGAVLPLSELSPAQRSAAVPSSSTAAPSASAAHVHAPPPRRSRFDTDPSDLPEEQPLFLPHALSIDDLEQCADGLAEIESRLREGQLRDALDKIRIHLHVKSRLVIFKARNVRNQEPNKEARGRIDANNVKIDTFVQKYRAARHAREALGGPTTWQHIWQPLRSNEVRCLHEPDPTEAAERSGEGRRTVSWIWMGADSVGGHESDANHVRGLNNGALPLVSLILSFI